MALISVDRTRVLAWEMLVELYGGEDMLRQRTQELKAAGNDEIEDLIQG